MFQSGRQRERAEDEHICSNCSRNTECTLKPQHYGWRFILEYCARYEELPKAIDPTE